MYKSRYRTLLVTQNNVLLLSSHLPPQYKQYSTSTSLDVLPIFELHLNGIINMHTFYLPSLDTVSIRFIHVVSTYSSNIFSLLCNILLYNIYQNLTILLLMDIWVLFCLCKLCCILLYQDNKKSFLMSFGILDIELGVRLLGWL